MENVLSQLGARRIMWSQFVLRSDHHTPSQLAETIWRVLDNKDRLLVSEIVNWTSYNLMIDDINIVRSKASSRPRKRKPTGA